MDIRINKLSLRNFKGAREVDITFDGHNATIAGPNGSGKSTVFDAFTWLLFGKDHAEQADFEIAPIDPETGEDIHDLETSVEAVLSVDGARKTLRRVWTENWVTPTGETERILKGHKSSFFVDGVDVATKKAYDATIAALIDEGVFRMITNTLYFIDDRYTKWQNRRKALMELVAGDKRQDDLHEQFADLVAQMNGEDLETFRKRIAAEKKANRADLAQCSAWIVGMKKSLPAPVDTEEALREIKDATTQRDRKVAQMTEKIMSVDKEIADVAARNEAKQQEIAAVYKDITAVQLQMSKMITDEQGAVASERAKRSAAVLKTQESVLECQKHLYSIDRDLKMARYRGEDAEAARAELSDKLKKLGEEYQAEKDRTFEYQPTTRCHACGQELPADMVLSATDAAREHFMAERREVMSGIIAEANELKAQISDWKKVIEAGKADIARLTSERESVSKELSEAESAARNAATAMETEPPEEIEQRVRQTPEFRALQAKEWDLRGKVNQLNTETVSSSDLSIRRRKLEDEERAASAEFNEQVRPAFDRLAVAKERERQQELISKEVEREARLADEVARLERIEFRAAEYAKAEVDAVEGAINSLFRECRWRMFEKTLDGGLVDMCQVTDLAGVPYGSLNSAQRIACGMDVIRVFGRKYEALAPIFVDNAESITRRDFSMDAQVIRLVVEDRPGMEVEIEK